MVINIILNKEKAYCSKCYQLGILTELEIDNENMYKAPSCEHFGRYFSYLSWCENCKDFTSHRGLKRNSFCYRCIMVKNCNTAIQNGIHSSQNPETSLINKEIHKKTINSQIKNGTFNMMNPKIHEKATKNKMKNYSSGYCNCNKCGKKNVILNSFGICSECQSKVAMEIMKDKFCKKCNKITPHNGKVCCICHPESNIINRPNFIIKNNIRYYKDKELAKLCDDLLSGKENISQYSGFEIRKGRITYNSKDILTDENILFNSIFHEKDKIKYYYDSVFGNNDYIPWEDYKKMFVISSENVVLLEEFKLISTFRTQDSEDWTGSRAAFEQNLIDEEIGWFVYIKFYISKDGTSLPLVCGKSGSLLVNSRGSDVSFSTNVDDGPGRRFLFEENLQWDKTKIAILKCESEQEALEKEKYYQNKYHLFGS